MQLKLIRPSRQSTNVDGVENWEELRSWRRVGGCIGIESCHQLACCGVHDAQVSFGALIWGIGLSFGGTTGFAVNPARDLAPRIAHAILPIAGKRSSDWGYAPIPIFGPLIGGGLAGLPVRFLGF